MTSVLPSNTSPNGLINWLVGGMLFVVGFYAMEATLSPSIEEAIRKN